jgi:hypothetical protein
MNTTIALTQQDMPWVTALTWFRGLDHVDDGSEGYGIIDYSAGSFSWTPSAQIFCNYTNCKN